MLLRLVNVGLKLTAHILEAAGLLRSPGRIVYRAPQLNAGTLGFLPLRETDAAKPAPLDQAMPRVC